jgi:hypothetical protein
MEAMRMITIALQTRSLEELQVAVNLRDHLVREEARKAFVASMIRFKQDPPTLVKDTPVYFAGQLKYKYAALDQVCNEICKALSKVGIAHAWSLNQLDGLVTVTCTLTHELGHSESVSMSGPPDTSGQKNSVQSIASTKSYLERYTLLAITGMATEDEDTDGRIPSEDLENDIDHLMESKNIDELKARYKMAFDKATKKPDLIALMAIRGAKASLPSCRSTTPGATRTVPTGLHLRPSRPRAKCPRPWIRPTSTGSWPPLPPGPDAP